MTTTFGRIAATAGFLAFGSVAIAQTLPMTPELQRRLMSSDFDELSSDSPNGRTPLSNNGCVLVNNVWNPNGVPNGFQQRTFEKRYGEKMLPGWQWNAPGKSTTVLSMPEIVCGDKPWDAPQALRKEFPIRAGDKAPIITFDIDLKATGTYNMAFSLWAVSRLPAVQKTISLEIMIWNVAHGQVPAGDKIGAVEAAETTFDLYLKKDQGMVTGPDPFTWPLVQYVARKPVLKGKIDFRPFLDDLMKRQILKRGHYLTSVELGNEVTDGTGEVRLKRFEVGVR